MKINRKSLLILVGINISFLISANLSASDVVVAKTDEETNKITTCCMENCNNMVIIPIADPRILEIQIKECGEPLVDLRDQTKIAFGPPPERIDNICYTKVRKSVYERLCDAQDLLPKGMRFCLYEGWRSLDLQRELFQTMYQKNQEYFPHLSHEQLFIETTKLASPLVLLDGNINIPPHSTGAAIDVYLIDDNGTPLNMGILIDQWSSDIGARLSQTHSPDIDPVARNNRLIMSMVLSKVGFVNYPNEYWHWSYGDRYWAYYTHTPQAIYDSVNQ